jgi:uncharacterized damage-inducible protein DinB
MTTSLNHALIAHADSVFFGPNGDYAAVMEALDGMTAEQALWKPSPAQNSIWQIVEHLVGSKEWLIEMIKGGEPAAPQWIEPSGDEAAWQATMARLRESHRRLTEAIAAQPEADLLEIPVPALGRTLLELILSPGPAHEAHHSGQIDYLKGLQKSLAATPGSGS